MNADKKKAVVIGSGFGGLTTAVLLGQEGYDVTVLEQAARPGGCLQCFTRGGAKFETGMHFIGSAGPGELLDSLFRRLGIGDLPLSRLDPAGYDVISLGGERFALANGREACIDTLARRFPDQRANLNRYFDLVERVAAASSLNALRDTSTTDTVLAEYQLRSIDDVLAEVISDPLLRDVLAGNLSLYAGEAGKTPFTTHAFITDFYNRSAWRVAGGSDIIAERLIKRIGELDGRLLTRARAVEIVCDDTRARAVRTADGRVYDADVVISAIHPAPTMQMVGSSLIRPAFRRRMASLTNTVGAFTVYLRFRPDTVPYQPYNFYGYTGRSPWGCERYDEQSWPKGYLYMHMCDADGQRYARSGVIITYMQMADVAPWADSGVGRRGQAYEQYKRQRAERLIATVEREYPGLRDAVEAVYTSTPLTYRDYTGTPDGSLYGVARDVNRMHECRVSHRTRVPNLLLTGQNINSHGILGVMVGSLITLGGIRELGNRE